MKPLPRPRLPKAKNRAVTLVEVMVSTVLFTLLALSVGSVALMSMKDTERTILENTATAVVYSISDQLSALPLNSLSLPDLNADRLRQDPTLSALTELPPVSIRLRPGTDADASTNIQIVYGTAPTGALRANDARPTGAIDNNLPALNLSDPAISTQSSPLRLMLWVWSEPYVPNPRVTSTIKVTIVYTINANSTGILSPTRGVTSFIRYVDVANRTN
jgi:type II secretory pathway pseudopilin PulG